MKENNKIELFKKTDTTLVYIASIDYTKELLKSQYKPGDMLYIHVKRSTGFVLVYKNNDCDHVVQIDMKEKMYILDYCENER